MRKFHSFAARWAGGFTLIELMVVILVITILTVIAVPSYLNQTLKSHRSEAKSILMDLAAREERYLATNGVYSSTASDLGLNAWGSMGNGYYTVAAPTIGAPAAATSTAAAQPATFSFTAIAAGGQAKDTNCAQLTLTSAGVQSSATAGTSGTATSGCW